MADPSWLVRARKYLGTREIPGRKHNPVILKWWRSIFSPVKDDETPYCAAFVGHVLEEDGIRSTRKENARSYTKWGQKCGFTPGAIIVFWRGSKGGWQGHVGFLVGRTKEGRLKVLGANQGNSTTIADFDTDRLLDLRWPPGKPVPVLGNSFHDLPLLVSGTVSKNEA